MSLLVKYYNQCLMREFYPNRQLKALDITLEKGKGPVLGKLRTIQLIEADFQMLMCIFINMRGVESIERDPRLSKYNFDSRKNYSIDEVLLKKS